jgi:hypothetical protein
MSASVSPVQLGSTLPLWGKLHPVAVCNVLQARIHSPLQRRRHKHAQRALLVHTLWLRALRAFNAPRILFHLEMRQHASLVQPGVSRRLALRPAPSVLSVSC